MGYVASSQGYMKCYVASEDMIVANDAEKSSITVAYVKLKEIELVAPIVGTSLFRFKFDMKSSFAANHHYGRIYRNGVAIGTEQEWNAVNYNTFSEDILATNWEIGDTIELWVNIDNAGNGVVVRNLRMYGLGSEFVNTLGM